MNTLTLLLLFASLLVLCSCSPSSSPSGGMPAEEAADDESDAWWQLRDDSVFTATTDPWPPVTGQAMLKAEVTMDDSEQKFAGTVAYRIATNEQNSEAWKPMLKTGETEDGDALFEASIDVPSGTVYIQFRLRDAGDQEFADLTDWSIEVK